MRYNPLASAPADLVHLRYMITGDAWISIFSSDRLLIGSDGSCDLRPAGGRIGRRHAEIYPQGDSWWVRDLGSAGGTYLDDESIDVARLCGSATLRLGGDGPTIRVALHR